MENTIQVEMLGGLTVRAGGIVVLEEAPKINKPWQVLCYLVINRAAGPVTPAKLIEALWPDESLIDPGNVLKNTVYALRREFKGFAGACGNPVLFEHGGYLCNPAVDFVLDAELFDDEVNRASGKAPDVRRRLLQNAVALYKGDFLPQLADDTWVIPRKVYYTKQFGECMAELGQQLYGEGRYSELLAVARAALRVDPLGEEFLLQMMRALAELKMYRVILPLYQKYARLFTEELGEGLNEEIKAIYAAASEEINPIEQDIMTIKDELQDVSPDDTTMADSPLYCTYDVFKYLYQMVVRTSERQGNRILMLLVSLQDIDGGVSDEENLDVGMRLLHKALQSGLLRKSDTFSRYSKSQFIIMLCCDQANGAEPVVWRIRQKLGDKLEDRDLRIVFATTELDTNM